MTFRILIVEDEAVVARRLERLLSDLLVDRASTFHQATSIAQANEWMANHAIDVLFLDLNLHGHSGFQILGDAVSRPFQTIIVSAHDDQAIRAFEYGVTDFVVKPFSEARLRQALARLFERDAPTRQSMRYLAVRRAGEVRPIAIADVVYIQGAGDYAELHCRDGTTHLHDKSLSALEHLLPINFVRVHRSFVANMDSVARLRSASGSRYSIELATGDSLPVGRARVAALRGRLV
ncbi:MAG: LytTR family DNA-binding domain-containing protein [Dokdonella sp.]